MLIRFVIENFFSFGERKEFTAIPNSRLKTLNEHKYNLQDIELLKLSSIYGANGSGKSNLIKSLSLLQELVKGEVSLFVLGETKFKFKDEDEKQVLVIEFFQENESFCYGIEILNDLVITEELYKSGLGKKADTLIFERKTNSEKMTEVHFSEEFEKDEKSQILKTVLLEDFIKPDELILKLISNRDNPFLQSAKKAFRWFDETLKIITPNSSAKALTYLIEKKPKFKKFVEDLLQSFKIGITSITAEKQEFEDIKQERFKPIRKLFENDDNPPEFIGFLNEKGHEIILEKEEGKLWAKSLKIGHTGKGNKEVLFNLDEESDGTLRLLNLIPAFKSVIEKEKVFVVDELERSVHPLLIKELVKKFSLDPLTKGQLIFTTHESNLLDQEIFRQDEIWFVEKNKDGSSDLYSLSDFKEHKTIDICKGYLNGRYGSIPFLGNLEDLNWHTYDIDSSKV